jgi:hypothetical protein
MEPDLRSIMCGAMALLARQTPLRSGSVPTDVASPRPHNPSWGRRSLNSTRPMSPSSAGRRVGIGSRLMRWGRSRNRDALLSGLEVERDIDDHVLLAADQAAPAGLHQ